ncbi:MAG: class II aldolase/adducin family protein [candidate division Zixibacteria bacterium]|nr:class II aldolase/adducin family protein [candidate division Zixibacteria bacterium]
MEQLWKITNEIREIGRLIYDKGLAAGTDGNISYKVADDRLLITASGTCLGELRATDILYIDFAGTILSGKGTVSSELPMHIAAYKNRLNIKAVVHAHPPVATGFSIAGINLAGCVIPEIVMTLGEIPTAPYATPSSSEGAHVISDLITSHDAILLDRHGAITVGKALREAFFKLEKVEYAAKVTLTAKQLGQVRQLTPEQVEKLTAISRRTSGRSINGCTDCGTCGDR